MPKKLKQFSTQCLTFAAFLGWSLINPLGVFAQFGTIDPPPGVDQWQAKVEAQGGSIGLILFLSNVIRLVTIAAGIWTMINFILAGWTYITSSGDASAAEKASKQMINSVIGLMVVALAYTIAAALGLLIFGDAGFIINPTLVPVDDL